ncbi:TorD/DmsD family molecular chaperone [Thermicanus aegyptius]|uniref:TorD/DmsD family molecular chaperone n=1 Tax=Thermicanus aegyptius TaxID=94009 RepID=UPI0004240313|nr:molecular chaperone TorD family protein [Thermicanus aegyptius]
MLNRSEITMREEMYQFFASFFLKEPSEGLLEGLRIVLPSLKEDFQGEEAILQLERLLTTYTEKGRRLEDFQQDFYDLFFVPISGRYAPAVESVLLHHQFWGEAERDLAERYRRAWFYPDDLEIYPPLKQLGMADYLGFELAYMAHLCNMETYSGMGIRKRVEQEEAEILDLHLLLFVNRYLPKLQEAGEETLYFPMLQLLQRFIEKDRQLLSCDGGM